MASDAVVNQKVGKLRWTSKDDRSANIHHYKKCIVLRRVLFQCAVYPFWKNVATQCWSGNISERYLFLERRSLLSRGLKIMHVSVLPSLCLFDLLSYSDGKMANVRWLNIKLEYSNRKLRQPLFLNERLHQWTIIQPKTVPLLMLLSVRLFLSPCACIIGRLMQQVHASFLGAVQRHQVQKTGVDIMFMCISHKWVL